MPPPILANVENLADLTVEFWVEVLLVIAGLFVLSFIFEKLFKTSRLILGIAFLAVIAIIGYKWIRHRNEPAFMTPVINVLAPIFGGSARRAAPPASAPPARPITPPAAPPPAVPPRPAAPAAPQPAVAPPARPR
ncbi:MAG: hypothetical protein LBM92_01745 [Opitutaceae bacterium]|jgi:hypothetical protein|nr:hypothetical protein [Opitutaceae bacterium]